MSRRREEMKGKAYFLGFTPDGRRRYTYDYWLDYHGVLRPPIAGGAPDSSDDQVDANSDDGQETEDSGQMNITGSLLGIDSSSDPSGRFWSAFRFHNGPFPAQGDTVDVAYAQFYVQGTDADDINCDIHAQDIAAPLTFTAVAFNITNRPRTIASAAWVQNALGIGWKQSPSLKSVIQEIVTSHTVTAIVLIYRPRSDVWKACEVRSRVFGAAWGAKLHLEWTEPVGIGADEMMAAIAGGGGAGGGPGGAGQPYIEPVEIVSY